MTLNEALQALIDAKARAAGPFAESWDAVEIPKGQWTHFSVWLFDGPSGLYFDDATLKTEEDSG